MTSKHLYGIGAAKRFALLAKNVMGYDKLTFHVPRCSHLAQFVHRITMKTSLNKPPWLVRLFHFFTIFFCARISLECIACNLRLNGTTER